VPLLVKIREFSVRHLGAYQMEAINAEEFLT